MHAALQPSISCTRELAIFRNTLHNRAHVPHETGPPDHFACNEHLFARSQAPLGNALRFAARSAARKYSRTGSKTDLDKRHVFWYTIIVTGDVSAHLLPSRRSESPWRPGFLRDPFRAMNRPCPSAVLFCQALASWRFRLPFSLLADLHLANQTKRASCKITRTLPQPARQFPHAKTLASPFRIHHRELCSNNQILRRKRIGYGNPTRIARSLRIHLLTHVSGFHC